MKEIINYLKENVISKNLVTDELTYEFEYKGTCFDVNPTTLEKEKSNSIYPSFISKEK